MNQDEHVRFDVVVVYRFKDRRTPEGDYRCYADVLKKGSSTLRLGETIILRGRSEFDIERGVKLHVMASYEKTDSWNCRDYQVYLASKTHLQQDWNGLINFFSGPNFKGIGKAKAKDIVDTLGLDCIDRIEDDPACLEQVTSLTPDMRSEIIDYMVDSEVDMLVRKFCPNVSAKFLEYMNLEHYNDGVMILRSDPYTLLDEADRCHAITFDIIDRIGRGLGVGMTSKHRIRHGVRHVVRDMTLRGVKNTGYVGGSSLLNISDPMVWQLFVSQTVSLLNLPWDIIWRKIQAGEAGVGVETVYGMDGKPALGCYLNEVLKSEMTAGQVLWEAITSPSLLSGKVTGMDVAAAIESYENDICNGNLLDQDQRTAVMQAIRSRVSVVTGGPGRGKTTVVQGVIYAWKELCELCGQQPSVTLAAPTGMAVCRLDEAVKPVNFRELDRGLSGGSSDYDSDSMWGSGTIARYVYRIKTEKSAEARETAERMFNNGTSRLVIIDEMSMAGMGDIALFISLMPNSHFVFVGDVDQLPSIDSGDVFLDLMRSGVIPVTTLQTNYRSKGAAGIVENTERVHLGNRVLQPDPGVFDIEYFDNENPAMLDFIVKTYQSELASVNHDISELALIVPRNTKGLCCASHLNTVIRNILNPQTAKMPKMRQMTSYYCIYGNGDPIPQMSYMDSIDKKRYTFRVGDRVVITANNCAQNDYVVNGDRGFIREFRIYDMGSKRENYTVNIELDDGRMIAIDDGNIKHVSLAYATTVHKSQGCEYKSVMFIAQGGMCFGEDFATRNLIYTGITRAKKHCYIIGLKSTVEYCITHPRRPRFTMLGLRISGHV